MDKSTRETVYEFIVNYKIKHGGIAPTVREICAGCGMSSKSTAHYHLMQLEAHGRIARVSGEPRSIGLPGETYTPPRWYKGGD